jgi:hypothetical protein
MSASPYAPDVKKFAKAYKMMPKELKRHLRLVAEGKAVTVPVQLNGTNFNPYAAMGFKSNPFPTIPKAEFTWANAMLADLRSKPIKDTDDLRKRMKGCSEELIELCVSKFQKGAIVTFSVAFPI